MLGSSDRGKYIESLELIRGLEFDMLVPWATAGAPYHAVVDRKEAERRLDTILERVRAGKNQLMSLDGHTLARASPTRRS